MSARSRQVVTIADIARAAGVSRSTVSIVLRGQAEQRKISEETTSRVQQVIRDLNYVPNQAARNLRLQRTGMIGVVVANLRWSWAETVLDGMLEVFRPGGYTPFVAVHQFDAALARKELLSCLRRRDEGVICQPMPREKKVYTSLRQARVPLVFLGDRPEDMPDVSFVGWDSSAAARLAVEHLVETGHKRIGFVGVDYPMEMTRGRYEAYRSVLREAGLPSKEHWIANAPLDWPLERIISWSMDRLFAPGQERPDAIFALNDGLALPLLEEFDVRGIRVPTEVAVIGLGNLPMTGHSRISLSTVTEPAGEMGRQAADVILQLIADPDKAPIQRLIPGQDLNARRTTQPSDGSATRSS